MGIKEVDDSVWLVSFMSDDFGFIDLEQQFSTTRSGHGCHPCPRNIVSPMSSVRTFDFMVGVAVLFLSFADVF